VTGIWTSLTSHPSISGPIDGVFRLGVVLAWRPERPAVLTAFPRATMVILIMGGAQTHALVLALTPPAASQRPTRRIATYPLLTTWGVHQRRRGIAPEPAMLAGPRLGFHAVGSQRRACSGEAVVL
jgi:hypothetical protein